MNIIDPFILKALVAGVGVALIAGIMGCFVVWRRLAYFGDSLSHSALLGIVLGLATGVSVNISVIVVCCLFALLLLLLQHKKTFATDTLLGILAHAALSIGMVVVSLLSIRFNLHAYLFGDILTVSQTEIYWIYGGGTVVIALLLRYWSSLLLMTLDENLALAEGVPILLMNMLLMFLMTIVVAVSIRIVGILLITSLLIIPAATARQLVKSPEMMALVACLLAIFAVVVGVFSSVFLDTPTGPSIVVICAVLFVLLMPLAKFFIGRQSSN